MLLGLLALGACNAIFGIEPGLPGGTTGPGAGGAGGSSSSGSTCSPAPGAAQGTARKILVSASEDYDQGNAVVHDAQDNLIAAGHFAGSALTLGKSIAHVGTAGMRNGFVVKQGPDGATLWGRAFGGSENLRLNAAGTDDTGNIYVTGTFSGMATSGEIDLTAAYDAAQSPDSQPDALVIALSPDNKVLWYKRFGNGLAQRGHHIAVDAAGNTYVAGTSQGKVDFGDGSGAIGDASGWWSFFLKLDPTGKPLWAQPIGSWVATLSPDPDETFEIALTLDGKGHVIIGGAFQGTTFFGSSATTAVGGADAFVASLDAADGKLLWHRTFHQPEAEMAPDGDQWITALTVEPCSGDIYAAGGFTEGIDFESAGNAVVSHGMTSDQDMFLAKLAASDGTPIWFHAYGDSGKQEPTAVKVAPDGTVLFTGFLINGENPQGLDCGPVIKDLPPGEGDFGPTSDLFLLKLDALGNGIWGKRHGDIQPQAAFDTSVDSKGSIVLGGLTNGTLALGGSTPAQSSSTIDVFLARFDP
jgi:Beta-propeller repeat